MRDGSRLYRGIEEVVIARAAHEIAPALERLSSRAGRWAGYLSYEAGLALEPKLAALRQPAATDDAPLLWFARFGCCERLDSAETNNWIKKRSEAPGRLEGMQPSIEQARYADAFARIADAIAAGDIYQANLTFPLSGRWTGDPFSIYAALRPAMGASHGAFLFDGERYLLSFSPELFFRLRGQAIHVRPMKGTSPRGRTAEEDGRYANALRNSIKDRAENLMIVDLLRNDLSRISVPGSVRVEQLFAIERYPTLHQMTSSVTSMVAPAIRTGDILGALFPCGSITGAPKIRAMQLIAEVEARRRGVYCGSIGRVDPSGDAEFNVAIRTLVLAADGTASLGIGSGVVADSAMSREWEECLLKARFLQAMTGATAQR
ncbi:aminodeoxychorismate synthase component I [Sphingomonas oryzagri]|uniref:Aminodeoxychorismate synthase component I n=1 Tax=Sphingomonas oryzagri TaxID=3042314 RepID=A0ABT6N1Y1_9SPHN|nr:aminodeoxychorismate synthase component I [Sphingomonas oryzagri]MDH7639284.1 aminodeoxychorismate synthase component I [Sphingomonas oryzagri]